MKYLTVIRHAKSSWNHPGLADHDRPLNDRGRRAAPAIAHFLHHTYLGGHGGQPLLPFPDHLLSSTAVRALTTAQIVREELGLPPDALRLSQRLYLAPESELLRAIQELQNGWQHVVIFGHNPGLHDFINRLLARGSITRFPTCAATILALPIDAWSRAEWNQAQLVGQITPRLLQRRFPDRYPDISAADGE
ncbi:MAG: histidine phosphatase family protein [Verrucomicrobiales bacterium]|nr:histidine phosphatase family protein [Verrucomicrobiales bacterium]